MCLRDDGARDVYVVTVYMMLHGDNIPGVRLFVIRCSMAILRSFQAAHFPGVSIVASRYTLFYHPFISTHAFMK